MYGIEIMQNLILNHALLIQCTFSNSQYLTHFLVTLYNFTQDYPSCHFANLKFIILAYISLNNIK